MLRRYRETSYLECNWHLTTRMSCCAQRISLLKVARPSSTSTVGRYRDVHSHRLAPKKERGEKKLSLFCDVDSRCPIYEATRRGLGAAMLRKPARLAELVRSVSERCPLPFSVKIRTGPERGLIAQELVDMLQVSFLCSDMFAI